MTTTSLTRVHLFPNKIELAIKTGGKYNERQILQRLRKYVRYCIDKKETPFIEQLALKLGVSDMTLRNWEKDEDKKAFAEWLNILRTVQKLDLKRKSLSGEYVSTIGNLLLSADHNVVQLIRREVGGMDGKPIEVEQTLSPEARKAYADEITKIFQKIYSKPNGKRPN